MAVSLRHRPRWVVAFGAGLLLLVTGVGCHTFILHVDGVHSSADLENWCVEVHASGITDDTVRERLEPIMESNALGWESRDTINFFSAGSIECSESVDRSVYELEFHIWDDVVDDGACENPLSDACVDPITVQGFHDGV